MRNWKSLSSVAAIFIIICGIGCKKADIEFGEQFIDAGYTNIVVVDTITPVLSTVFRDSVATSQTSSVLVGSYKDPYFGKITTSSYLILSSPSAGIPDLHVSAMFDSIELQMRGDSSFYGDTAVVQKFNVNRLTTMIQLPENLTYLYNTSSFPAESTPLGSANVLIRPSLKDSVKIRLTDALGQDLWSLIKSKDFKVSTANDFEHYFYGLKLSAENANAAVLGFSDSVTMRLFYHESNPYVVTKYIDFALTSRNRQFNHIDYDRSGTPLAITIPPAKEIPATTTANTAFTQSLTNVFMKMTFPTLRSLPQRDDYVRIMRADLIIPPLKSSFDPLYMPPPLFQASATSDANNALGGTLATSGAVGSQGAQQGNLTIDWLYGENTYYTYDLTGYVQQQVAITGENNGGLIFYPPSPAYTKRLNRLVVGNSQNPLGGVKLKVYYVSVQPQ
ncbi:MAG: DUF4270 family protein [Agriterribacter sp.]